MAEKRISRSRSGALDGLRAAAITIIILSHTGILNQGGFGNIIFFTLSGFFAAMPFSPGSEKKFLSVKYSLGFYLKKLIRILPVYYAVLAAVYYLSGTMFFKSDREFIKNALFLDCYGHLWFLQQEMVMYFIVPFLMAAAALIKKLFAKREKCFRGDFACAAFLILLTFLARRYLTVDVFSLHANGKLLEFRVWPFTTGMAFGFIYRWFSSQKERISKGLGNVLSTLSAVLLFAFCIATSPSVLSRLDGRFEKYYIADEHPVLCAAVVGFAVLFLLGFPESAASKLLSLKPLNVIGRISFGMYLIHFFLLPYVRLDCELKNFIAVYIISACTAFILHVLIERPFERFAKTKDIKELGTYYKNLIQGI